MSYTIEQVQTSLYRITVVGSVDEALLSELFKKLMTVLMINPAPVDFLVDVTELVAVLSSGQDFVQRLGSHPQLGVLVFYGFNPIAARMVKRLQRRIRNRVFFFPTESQASAYVRMLRRKRRIASTL